MFMIVVKDNDIKYRILFCVMIMRKLSNNKIYKEGSVSNQPIPFPIVLYLILVLCFKTWIQMDTKKALVWSHS